MLDKYNVNMVLFHILLLTCEVFLNIRLYRIPGEDLSLTLSLFETASSEVRFVFMLTVNRSLSFAPLLSLNFVPSPVSKINSKIRHLSLLALIILTRKTFAYLEIDIPIFCPPFF